VTLPGRAASPEKTAASGGFASRLVAPGTRGSEKTQREGSITRGKKSGPHAPEKELIRP